VNFSIYQFNIILEKANQFGSNFIG